MLKYSTAIVLIVLLSIPSAHTRPTTHEHHQQLLHSYNDHSEMALNIISEFMRS